ncbi:hypothetical protein AAHA92_09866 [Salvia divinorum]|uniref:Uncharacterized protein n=1 Tax=Salvia divinorum TaxID=28513 RepID=A0ABD1HST2_SALDI
MPAGRSRCSTSPSRRHRQQQPCRSLIRLSSHTHEHTHNYPLGHSPFRIPHAACPSVQPISALQSQCAPCRRHAIGLLRRRYRECKT